MDDWASFQNESGTGYSLLLQIHNIPTIDITWYAACILNDRVWPTGNRTKALGRYACWSATISIIWDGSKVWCGLKLTTLVGSSRMLLHTYVYAPCCIRLRYKAEYTDILIGPSSKLSYKWYLTSWLTHFTQTKESGTGACCCYRLCIEMLRNRIYMWDLGK